MGLLASQAHLAHLAPLGFQETVASQDRLDPVDCLVLKALLVTLGRKVPKVRIRNIALCIRYIVVVVVVVTCLLYFMESSYLILH